MGKRSRQVKTKIETLLERGKHSRVFYFSLTTGFVVLLLLVVIMFSYLNVFASFLPKTWALTIDSMVSYLPLPLNSRQVLERSLLQNQRLKTYSVTSHLQAGTAGFTLLSLNLDGKIDTTESASQAKLSGSVNALASTVDAEILRLKDNLFVNIHNVPSIPGFNLQGLAGSWYQINEPKLEKELRVDTKSDAGITGDVETFWDKNDWFSLLNRFDKATLSTTVSGKTTYYKIDTSLQGDQVKKLLGVDQNFSTSRVSLLINKKTFYLEKVTLATTLVSRLEKINLSFDYKIGSINQDQKIVPPSQADMISSAAELALLMNRNKVASGVVNLKIGDTGENFLTVERLVKVFLLLPQAL